MARNFTPKGKIVRRFGVNIFGNPKYDRLLQKRSTPPGEHGGKPSKLTEYGKRLKDKQKLKFCYGVSEGQFKNMFMKAKTMKGVTGHNMLILLERRLDNVVYRLRMASSRAQARQLVTHGHIQVNGRKVSIPSYLVYASATVSAIDTPKSRDVVRQLIADNQHRAIPEWLYLSEQEMKGHVHRLPAREDIPTIANEQLVVEFYSR
jgi:small subunit ribosomal protein S4